MKARHVLFVPITCQGRCFKNSMPRLGRLLGRSMTFHCLVYRLTVHNFAPSGLGKLTEVSNFALSLNLLHRACLRYFAHDRENSIHTSITVWSE